MGDYSERKADFAERNIAIVTASADSLEKATEQAATLGLTMAWGVDQAMIEGLGGYWQGERAFSQPAEFLLGPDNRITCLSYSDGPLGRIDAADVLRMVKPAGD